MDISSIRSSASEHILGELRQSYDKAISNEFGTSIDYWRSHRSSIALLVVEYFNARYSNKLRAIFEVQDFHTVSAQALIKLYAESELDIIRAMDENYSETSVHDAVVASYITRMQIADYILQSKELTNIIYFCSSARLYSWIPEYLLIQLEEHKEQGIQSPDIMFEELREMLRDLTKRHAANCTTVYFNLSNDKHLKDSSISCLKFNK